VKLPSLLVKIASIATVLGIPLFAAGPALAFPRCPGGSCTGYSVVYDEGSGSGPGCDSYSSDGSKDTHAEGTTATVTSYNSDGSTTSATYTCTNGGWVAANAPGQSPGLSGPVLGRGQTLIGPSSTTTTCGPTIEVCSPAINPWPPRGALAQ
jgi:hypothetical protein